MFSLVFAEITFFFTSKTFPCTTLLAHIRLWLWFKFSCKCLSISWPDDHNLSNYFLSDYACHSRLANLIDLTLVCEDAYSKLVEVVVIGDVDDENRVGNSSCRFGSWGLVIKLNFCSDLEHKVWSRFWNWSSGKICMVKRFPTLEKSWLSCRHWLPLSLLTHSLRHLFPYNLFVTRYCCLVEILKLVHGRDYEEEI